MKNKIALPSGFTMAPNEEFVLVQPSDAVPEHYHVGPEPPELPHDVLAPIYWFDTESNKVKMRNLVSNSAGELEPVWEVTSAVPKFVVDDEARTIGKIVTRRSKSGEDIIPPSFDDVLNMLKKEAK